MENAAFADRADRKGGGGGTVLDAKLGVDLFKMLVDRARTEIENLGNVAVRFAARDPQQHFRLAFGHREFLPEQRPVVVDIALQEP